MHAEAAGCLKRELRWDGARLAERDLDVPRVFDGLIAAAGRPYASLEDGSLICLDSRAGKID